MTVQIGTTEHKQGCPALRGGTQRVHREPLSLQRCGALGKVPSCLPWPSRLPHLAQPRHGEKGQKPYQMFQQELLEVTSPFLNLPKSKSLHPG